MKAILIGWLFWYALLAALLFSACAIDPNGGGLCNNMLLASTVCLAFEDTGTGGGAPMYVFQPAPSYYAQPYPGGGYVIREK